MVLLLIARDFLSFLRVALVFSLRYSTRDSLFACCLTYLGRDTRNPIPHLYYFFVCLF
jgi:hypothetical protein